MILRRKLILMVSGIGCAYALMALLAPLAAPGLDSIECAAPPYFDALTRVEISTDHENGMNALRQQAGSALAQLQTKTAINP